ncbi:hypothetical protein [Flavobacterium selenitireducens]|uniref:hypothetical protein n=1 Tax=Flavobacterium selenitireducens TaxID=2722704 RepID=UPI00168A4C84|nr:hypothetical protein [Flavobacterium selenitireducens]MBD3584099.1 hypothetical protein [Flavobacterium selenitireducens]
MKVTLLIIFVIGYTVAYSQVDAAESSNWCKSEKFIELENEIKKLPVLVKTVSTCSTNPSLCGYLAFGSSTLVIILEGKYKEQKLYVSALCKETNYKVDSLYTLYFSKEPSFGVGFCNDQYYSPNWINDSESKKYPMIYGELRQ